MTAKQVNSGLVQYVKSYSYSADLVEYKKTVDKLTALQLKVVLMSEQYDEGSVEVTTAKSALALFEKQDKTQEILKRKVSYDALTDDEKTVIDMGVGIIPQDLWDNETFVKDMRHVICAAKSGTLKGDYLRDMVSAASKALNMQGKPYRAEDETLVQAFTRATVSGLKVAKKEQPINVAYRSEKQWEKMIAIYLYACFVG